MIKKIDENDEFFLIYHYMIINLILTNCKVSDTLAKFADHSTRFMT